MSMLRNLEAEQSVLGGILLDATNLSEIRTLVEPDDFAPEHRLIFQAMCRMHDAREPIDEITVTNALREAGDLEQAGGPVAVTMLVERIPSAANFRAYCRIVNNAGKVRRLSDEAMAVAFACKEANIGTEEDARTFFANAQRRIVEATTYRSTSRNLTTREVVGRVFKFAEERVKNRGQLLGFPTGLAGLDEKLLGLRRKRLHIVAARPGVGKTALAMKFAYAAASAGARVYVVNYEMGLEELGLRLVSSASHVGATRIEMGQLGDADFAKLARAVGELANLPIVWPEDPPASMAALRSESQALKRGDGLDVVIVDYLQLVPPEAGSGHETRDQQVGAISRAMKNLSRELDCAVVALSQLNRKTGDNTEPENSHLRESGSLEQDANVILHLWSENEDSDEVMAKLGKNRGGPLGRWKLRFEKAIQKITEAPNA
jgi:replicative DNA helicase